MVPLGARHNHRVGSSATYLLRRNGQILITIGCHKAGCEALTMNMRTWYQSLGELMSARGMSDQDVLLAELDPQSSYWVIYLLLSDESIKEAVPFLKARQCGEETCMWDVQVVSGVQTRGQNTWSPFGPVQSARAENLTQNLWQLLKLVPEKAVSLIGPKCLRLGFEHWRGSDLSHRRHHARQSHPSLTAV